MYILQNAFGLGENRVDGKEARKMLLPLFQLLVPLQQCCQIRTLTKNCLFMFLHLLLAFLERRLDTL